MEIPVEINSRVVEWLASMGYPVDGMPHELLRGMLLREARQWQISPSKLAAIINGGVSESVLTGLDSRYAIRESQSTRRTTWFVGAQG